MAIPPPWLKFYHGMYNKNITSCDNNRQDAYTALAYEPWS